MKKTAIALVILGLTAALGWAQAASQDEAKILEAYMKAGAVTANHEALKYFAGRWDVEATMWAMPGAPPSKSKNTNEGEMIMGGRYVRLSYKGIMMGQPFEGLQITGYDNIEKAYKTFWIDNSSTSFYLLSGQYDPAKKTYFFKGTWADPMGGVTPVRMVIKIVGPDEYASESFTTLPDGKEFKNMEDRSVRRK